MLDKKHKRAYIIFGVVIAILVFINLFGIIWHFLPGQSDPWSDNIFPGKIESITSDKITTVDPRGTKMEFNINDQTKFFLGREAVTIESVSVGKPVLIKTETATSTQVQELRIMTDKPKNKIDNR